MPFRPPVHKPVGAQSSVERRAAYDAAIGARSPIHSRRWRKLRSAFLVRNPLCACGCGYGATVVDHVVPHNGNEALLFAWNNLQAMTKACHDRKTAARDGGFGNPIQNPNRRHS